MTAWYWTKKWFWTALSLNFAVLVAVFVGGDLQRSAGDQFFGRTEGASFGVIPWPELTFDTFLDPMSARIALLAVVIAVLVQVFSTAYVHERRDSFGFLILVFAAAMVTVVITDNLLVLLIGWEVMGVCSFLLIGHHRERDDAQVGAARALLVTRTADIGLLVALVVIAATYGTWSILGATAGAQVRPGEEPPHATLIGLLLLVAVVGKSAQVPLQAWLPGAMPGPTPATALIHAATMVAAGVYLMARLLPLYSVSVATMTALALVSAVTMVYGAWRALRSAELKQALAWSTVSQLALMYGAVAVGATDTAVDHLLSHGVFKALLFLGCGAIMAGVAGQLTSGSMTVGFLALAGLPPTIGFFSKDGVVHALKHATDGTDLLGTGPAWVLFGAALLTVVLTAAYSIRLWREHVRPLSDGDEPRAFALPLLLLALGALVLPIWGEPDPQTVALVTGLAVVGLLLGWFVRRPAIHAERRSLVAAGGLAVARTVAWLDADGVDGWSRGGATFARWGSWLLGASQDGRVQRYVSVVVAGAAACVVLGVVR